MIYFLRCSALASRLPLLVLTLVCSLLTVTRSSFAEEPKLTRPDLVINDFESLSYDQWIVEGDAFGKQPARGTLPNQTEVTGYQGSALASSYWGGDVTTGTLTSPTFTIERAHIAFLIAGGNKPGVVGVELLVDGMVARRSTGDDSEELLWKEWNVSEFLGKQGTIRIFDNAVDGWGHISVDQIIQTDQPPDRFGLIPKLAAYRNSTRYMNEPLRPQFHFSSELNWLNDPNGLVYHDGEYHLFFQFNPAGNEWGHMSWGHAVSKDMVHWEHLPIALPETDGVMAFSGSCVIDHRNTSGFGLDNKPPMIAIYTGHQPGKQVQNLAYSNDNGRSWEFYEGNPVIDLELADFRDPKVFWHEPSAQWVMVVAFATEKVIGIFGSPDLKSWSELSRFGPAGVRHKPNWECPDLFELPIENEAGQKMWVLEADMGDGSIAGGSGSEYFVGHFDGVRFQAIQQAQWVDYGRDFYAPISFDNFPRTDARRVWLGWFNNWQTCLIPTDPWRGCMTVPRELSLRKLSYNAEEPATYVLVQKPAHELETLRVKPRSLATQNLGWPPKKLTSQGELEDMRFELLTHWEPGKARSLGFRIHTQDDEFTEIGYDRENLGVYVDRTKSGNVSFHPAFPGRHDAPARLIDGKVELRILVDRSSIEVFINDGEAVISDRIFPGGQQPWIEAFVGDPSAKIVDAKLWELNSVWQSR
ncbi:glycoside hydrolase family 32 protein [Pirellulaceae bacterium SH449]